MPPAVSDDQLALLTKLEHEIDHLHRHLATTYGILRHLIQSRQVDLFLQRINMASANEIVRSPMYEPIGDPAECGFHDPRTANATRMFGYEALAEVLACTSFNAALPVPWKRALAWHTIRTDLFSGGADCCGSPADWMGQALELPQAPFRVAQDQRWGKFGAFALMEVFAVSRELGLLEYAGLAIAWAAEQYFSSVPAYQQARGIWDQTMPEPLVPSLGAAKSGRPVQPLEFYAALDLALWPPIEPAHLQGEPLKCGFESIHPGWRFTSVMQAMKELGTRVTAPRETIDTETEHRWTAVQSEWAEHLGWPTPEILAKKWIDRLQARAPLPLRVWIQDDPHRTAAMIALLRARVRRPAFAAMGYWPAELPCMWFDAIGADRDLFETTWPSKDAALSFRYDGPVAYCLLQSLRLFAKKLPTDQRAARIRGVHARQDEPIERVLSAYAQRHYGFRVVADIQNRRLQTASNGSGTSKGEAIPERPASRDLS